jgi:FkbM family methyltransferase
LGQIHDAAFAGERAMLMQALCRIAPRRYRIYRLLSRLAPDRYERYRVEGGLIHLNLHESPMMVQRAMGVYEQDKTKLIRRLLRPGMTFSDVGANKGDFTLLAAKVVGPAGNVISIEPEPENYAYLRASIELNGYRNIRTFALALSDSDGTSRLRLAPKSGAHTLSPDQKIGNNTVPVTATTLDSLLDRSAIAKVDLIKIDVQGWELQVLRGARRTLRSNPAAVLLLDLPKQPGKRSAIGEYATELGLRLYRDFEFSAPTTTVPPGVTEIVAMRATG